MMQTEAVVRSLLYGALSGLLAAIIAAWSAVRPTSEAQIEAQRPLLKPSVWRSLEEVAPADGLLSQPVLVGAIVAVVVALTSLMVLSRRS